MVINMHGQVEEDIAIELPSQLMDYACLFPYDEFQVIQKRRDFKTVELDWEQKSCKKIGFPKIDFKENVLIGLKKHVRSCDLPEMKYEITKQNEVVTVEVQFFPNGNCQTSYECIYWFQIPSIELEEDSEFELNERYIYTDAED